MYRFVNSLPDDKFLVLSELEAIAGDKLNVTKNIKLVFHRVNNIVRKGENAGYQHFSFTHNVFERVFFIPPKTLFARYVGVSLSVGRSVRLSVRRSVCSFLSTLFLINYWTNFIQTSQVNSVSSRDVHMKCWLWFIDFFTELCPFHVLWQGAVGGYDHV